MIGVLPELKLENALAIATFIRGNRTNLGISQNQLGRLIGVSGSYVSNYESGAPGSEGKNRSLIPTQERWQKMQEIFDLSPVEAQQRLKEYSDALAADGRRRQSEILAKMEAEKKPKAPKPVSEVTLGDFPIQVLLQALADRKGLEVSATMPDGKVLNAKPRRRLPEWTVGDLIKEIKTHGFNSVTLEWDEKKAKREREEAQAEVNGIIADLKRKEKPEAVPVSITTVKKPSLTSLRRSILSRKKTHK